MFDNDTFEHEGATFRVMFPYDDDSTPPWERDDGHGPVSDWRRPNYNGRPDKLPGERELCSDHRSARFYDFAAAVALARKDGWGFLPGELETFKDDADLWHARVKARFGHAAQFEQVDSDINVAVRAVYAAHRATMTAKQYAAGAAESDFKRLSDWCNDRWQYVGVVVELLDDEGEPMGDTESIWGIESDSSDYLDETAHELAGEILSRLAAAGRGVHSEGDANAHA